MFQIMIRPTSTDRVTLNLLSLVMICTDITALHIIIRSARRTHCLQLVGKDIDCSAESRGKGARAKAKCFSFKGLCPLIP